MLENILGQDPHTIAENATKIFSEILKKLDEAEKAAAEKIGKNAAVIEEKTKENDSLNTLVVKISKQKEKLGELQGL